MRSVPISLHLLIVMSAPALADPRAILQQGIQAFERGDFAEAAAQFEQAAAQARGSDLDPSVPWFNQGVALYRKGLLDAAVEAFLRARNTTDLDRQARALYNAGTTRLRQFDAAVERRDGAKLETYLAEAIHYLERSLVIRPDQEHVRRQLEVALERRERLLASVQQLDRVLAEVSRLLEAFEFEKAHRILMDSREEVGLALLLPNEKTKAFEQMMERTGQIVAILNAGQTGNVAP
ncbi:MAG: hypothetical protein NZ740_08520 [Kiritimatiellae bacterium]|nr:hypothetical protein [Kiritimatiellia bacterium]MDW8459137.1 hypothetical protein [Verrucomicrobiota bacterium]